MNQLGDIHLHGNFKHFKGTGVRWKMIWIHESRYTLGVDMCRRRLFPFASFVLLKKTHSHCIERDYAVGFEDFTVGAA